MDKLYKGGGVYKSEYDIQTEFELLKTVTPSQLNHRFFQKNKTLFL
jgi:hypothetical protein